MTEAEFLREVFKRALSRLEFRATAGEGRGVDLDLGLLATLAVREALPRLLQAATLEEIRGFMLTGDCDALIVRLPTIFA